MIGYSPVELAIRATLGKPPDTGADDPRHDRPYKCRRCRANNHCEGATVNCDCLCAAMPAEQPEARPAA